MRGLRAQGLPNTTAADARLAHVCYMFLCMEMLLGSVRIALLWYHVACQLPHRHGQGSAAEAKSQAETQRVGQLLLVACCLPTPLALTQLQVGSHSHTPRTRMR
jgi:hypothetical protein